MNERIQHLPSIFDLPMSSENMDLFHKIDNFAKKNISITIKNDDETINTKGTWTQEEDQLLINAVSHQSPIVWDSISQLVPGRTAIQCKERWLYRLHPEIKKTRFEKWEDELIITERNKFGNHWTLIATKLPGRTSCAVKNRWYSVLRNKLIY